MQSSRRRNFETLAQLLDFLRRLTEEGAQDGQKREPYLPDD
jgi:hypothetical protein